MPDERKPYARYYIIRGHRALWRGDPSEKGAQFRQLVITSNEFNSTQGIFQLYGLEGTGDGIRDGKLAISEGDPRVLIDADFNGLDEAVKKFAQIVKETQAQGFKEVTVMDELEFNAKLKGVAQ